MEAVLPSRAPTPPIDILELLDVIRRRITIVIGCALVALVLAGLYIHRQHPVYRSTVEILVDPQGLQVVGRDILPSDSSASLDFASVDSQPLIIVSTGVLSEVIKVQQLEKDPYFAGFAASQPPAPAGDATSARFVHVLDMLRQNIVVHRADPSLVFQITVSHSDPARAADIANTISSVYLRQSLDARLSAVRRANESLLAQAVDLRSQFEKAERAVEQFRSENGLVATGTAGLVVNQRLQDLTAQVGQAAAQVSQLAARRDQMKTIDHTIVEAGGLPEAVASPTITALRTQYGRIAQTQAELERSLGPNHPNLQQNRSEREAVAGLIDAELGRIKQSINVEYARAVDNLAALQARSKEITEAKSVSNTAEIRARELQGEADAIQQVYNAVLNRTKELDLQQQIQTNNSRVISQAVPPTKTAAPSKVIVLVAGAVFGLVAGIAVAYGVEWLATDPISRLRGISGGLGTELIGVLKARRRGLPRLFGRKRAIAAAEERDRRELQPAAQALSMHLGEWLPVTILVVEAGPAPVHGLRVAKGLAGALADLGEETLLCSAADMSTMLRVEGSASPEARAAHRNANDRLLSARESAGGHEEHEFILIDGGASAADPTLGSTYAYVDAVVVVAATGEANSAAVRDLIASLGPLAAQTIGVVGVIDG